MKKKSSRLSKAIGATSIAIGLVSTWETPAGAQISFTGEITPTHDLTAVYFIFAVGTCSPGGGVFSKKISDFLPANTTTPFSINVSSVPANFSGQAFGFTVAALYDTINGGVALGYVPGQADNILAQSPAPEWIGNALPVWSFGGNDVFYATQPATESQTAAALAGGSFNGITLDDALTGGPLFTSGGPFDFSVPNSGTVSDFTLVDFSGASLGGTGFAVEVVPEPGTVSLFVASFALLGCGWLRRRCMN
jgi:hypothetical protein